MFISYPQCGAPYVYLKLCLELKLSERVFFFFFLFLYLARLSGKRKRGLGTEDKKDISEIKLISKPAALPNPKIMRKTN